MCRLPSWESRCLFTVLPLEDVIPDVTMAPVYETLVWSMRVLASGVHPAVDHQGRPFPPKSRRAAVAGQQLCGGFRFMACEILGDWKWLKDEFKLAFNYSKNHCCWKCKSTKSSGELCAFNFKSDAPWQQHPRSNAEYMAEAGRAVVLTRLPGFDLSFLLCDLMHILLLGVVQWAVGGVLWETCLTQKWHQPLGGARGPWQARMNLQLRHAYNHFRTWMRMNALTCSQPAFTVSGLSMSTLNSWPCLRAKAFNTLMVTKWLGNYMLCEAKASPQNEHVQRCATMLWGFTRVFDVCDEASMFLTPTQISELGKSREASLFSYAALAIEASSAAPAKALFPMKPKHHLYDHCLRHAMKTGRNPGWHTAFADEDFIGKIKSLASRCHTKTMAKRTLQRYLCRVFADAQA